MITWNCRSRSRGLSAHDRLESVLTIAWITHVPGNFSLLADEKATKPIGHSTAKKSSPASLHLPSEECRAELDRLSPSGKLERVLEWTAKNYAERERRKAEVGKKSKTSGRVKTSMSREAIEALRKWGVN